MWDLAIDMQYVNQFGTHIFGTVETSENVDVRVKVLKSDRRCGYVIAWDGRLPKMSEWAEIQQAVECEVRRLWDTNDIFPTLDHSTI